MVEMVRRLLKQESGLGYDFSRGNQGRSHCKVIEQRPYLSCPHSVVFLSFCNSLFVPSKTVYLIKVKSAFWICALSLIF